MNERPDRAMYQPSPQQKAEDERILAAIVTTLNSMVDALVPECLPRAVKTGGRFVIGSIEGEPGESMSIWRNSGIWKDYNPGTRRETGDMLHLVTHCLFGGNRGEAIRHYKSAFGYDDRDPSRIEKKLQQVKEAQADQERAQSAEDQKKRGRAAALFFGGDHGPSPFIPGTPADACLRRRGIDSAAIAARTGKRIVPRALRYRPDVWCDIRRDKFPAMLGGIFDSAGQFVAVHRTYLDIAGWDHAHRTGRVVALKVSTEKDPKARRIVPPDWDGPKKSYKMSMGRFGGMGASIPLWKGESSQSLRHCAPGEPVWISEGIEDALSWVMKRPDCRVHAAVSLSNMGGMIWPQQIGPVTLLMQNDPEGSDAVASLERVIAKQQAGGVQVMLQRPPRDVKDWNELLMKDMA